MPEKTFLEVLRAHVLPILAERGFVVVSHEESQSFDNPAVTLASSDLRLSIIRERRQFVSGHRMRY